MEILWNIRANECRLKNVALEGKLLAIAFFESIVHNLGLRGHKRESDSRVAGNQMDQDEILTNWS